MKVVHVCLVLVIAVFCLQINGKSSRQFLKLESTEKLIDLVGESPSGEDVLEGSGIVYRKDTGQAFIVCDNIYDQVIEVSSSGSSDSYVELQQATSIESYEGITFDYDTEIFYLVTEHIEVSDELKAVILSFSASFDLLTRATVDFEFEDQNKGIEGLATIMRNGEHYLLGLCEGNDCEGGSNGKEHGKGTILVLKYNEGVDQFSDGTWDVEDKIMLPSDLPFEDYSGLDILEGRWIAVVSQSDSSLWVGELSDDSWTIKGGDNAGLLYQFPEDSNGDTTFCGVEGVSWINSNSVVVATDKSSDDDDDCAEHSESVSVVTIPGFWREQL